VTEVEVVTLIRAAPGTLFDLAPCLRRLLEQRGAHVGRLAVR
jgi:hypothetical protein